MTETTEIQTEDSRPLVDHKDMSPRKELIATGGVAVLALVAACISMAAGNTGAVTLAALPGLAICAALAGFGVWRSSRVAAATRAATRLDRLTGMANGA